MLRVGGTIIQPKGIFISSTNMVSNSHEVVKNQPHSKRTLLFILKNYHFAFFLQPSFIEKPYDLVLGFVVLAHAPFIIVCVCVCVCVCERERERAHIFVYSFYVCYVVLDL